MWICPGRLWGSATCQIQQHHAEQRAQPDRHQPILLRRCAVRQLVGGGARKRHLLPRHPRHVRTRALEGRHLLRMQRHRPVPQHTRRERGARAIRRGGHESPPRVLRELVWGGRPLLMQPTRLPHRLALHNRAIS